MKRCPECRRDYHDETLLYCLDDGNALLEGPASGDEPATAILSESPVSGGLTGRSKGAAAATGIVQPRATGSDTASKRWRTPILLGVALLLAAGGVGFGVIKWFGSNGSSSSPKTLRITRLTSSGGVERAAISPDGKYVVYAQFGAARKIGLWMRQIAASSDVQIVPDEEGIYYGGLSFAPDGDFIYYVKGQQSGETLWRLPVLGGTARKINIENMDSEISLSPDGKRIAFTRDDADNNEESLIIANLDGSGERTLAPQKPPENFASHPVWSPDGQTIAVGHEDVTNARSVLAVRVDDGDVQPFSERKWAGNNRPQLAWLSDNSGVLVIASDDAGTNPQVWLLKRGGNEARQLTGDLSSYGDITLTADSGTICAVRSENITNLWVADMDDPNNAKRITSGAERSDGTRGINWTPDGKIAFFSLAGNGQNIWLIGADGTGARQLTTEARRNRDAAVSPDGRFVVWETNRGTVNTIWRMDIDGGNVKQLTGGGPDYYPQISPDGKWVLFSRFEGDENSDATWKVSIDGGAATPVSGTVSAGPSVISPDGTKIAYATETARNDTSKVVIIPFDGGPPLESFEMPERRGWIRWSPDSRSIMFVRDLNGAENIWAQPLGGGVPKQLTNFNELGIRNFAFSRDGKKLAMSRGSTTRDVVLMKDFR